MLDWIFIITAVIGTTIMLCQFALTVFGLSDDIDAPGDAAIGHGDVAHTDSLGGDATHETTISTAGDAVYQHHDSSWLFGVISFRTMVAAAAFFGLAGAAARSADWSTALSLAVAVAAGVTAMYGTYWLLQLISKLASSGNERIANSVGRPATVYIAIPAENQGAGKVQLSMQNRIVEYQAVTPEATPLKSGEKVEVVRVINSDTVEVCRQHEVATVM